MTSWDGSSGRSTPDRASTLAAVPPFDGRRASGSRTEQRSEQARQGGGHDRQRVCPVAGSAIPGVAYWRDLGATSRVADQSLLTAAVVVCESPAIGAASAMSAGSTAPGRPTFGVSSQIDAAPDQVGQRVDEAVDQVAVVVAPPQQHGVDHVAVVAVDHVGVDGVLDRDAEGVVGVVVPAELLDDHARACSPSRLRGPAVGPPCCWVDPPPAVALTVSSLSGQSSQAAAVACPAGPLRHVVHRSCGSTVQAATYLGGTARLLPERLLDQPDCGFPVLRTACDDGRVSRRHTSDTGTTQPPAAVIHEGLPTQLPDIDPDETQEWLESFDAMVDERGRERARYVMLRLLERAREQQRRRARAAQHRLHQHDPARARAVVPRRRGDRAPDPRASSAGTPR